MMYSNEEGFFMWNEFLMEEWYGLNTYKVLSFH
jgi:hypothetical protein